jgi:hypothetical protein
VAEQDRWRLSPGYELDALYGLLEVELGGRAGGAQDTNVGEEHAKSISHEDDAGIGIPESDVVARMPGRVDRLEITVPKRDDIAAGYGLEALSRDWLDRTEHLEEPLFAVHTDGAGHELGGILEVGRASLVDPHLGFGKVGGQRSGTASVIQVDVCDHDVRKIVRTDARVGQSLAYRLHRGGRSGLDQGGLGGIQQVAGGDLLPAAHHGVDGSDPAGSLEGLGHGREFSERPESCRGSRTRCLIGGQEDEDRECPDAQHQGQGFQPADPDRNAGLDR